MPSAELPHIVGQHRLGPHVVGTRVVVRRLVPGEIGPTGGPAFTDLLGTCLAWGRTCVLELRDGSRVEVPLSEIVSGKPVPPRPSVRQRVSPDAAERHALALWPGLVTASLGGWLLRCDPTPRERPRKRANSCLAFADPGVELDEALTRVVEFAAAHGREPLVQVELDGPLHAQLLDRGAHEVPGGENRFLIGAASRALRLLRDAPDVALDWGPEPATPEQAELRGTVATADGSARLSWAIDPADPDWVGLHELWVRPERRRSGLAGALIAAALERAAERGARTAWLHVESTNTAASHLYEGLGFTEHHRSTYLRVPTQR